MSGLTFGFKAQEVIDQDYVTIIQKWLDTQSLPVLADEQIATFLLSCCNDEEMTKKTIKAFYRIRKENPKVFDNRDVSALELQNQLETVKICLIPQRTRDGCAVLYHGLHDYNYKKYDMEPCMKLFYMTIDMALREHPPTGLIILMDMKGMGLLHITKLRPSHIRTFFQYVQEALPTRLKNIHVLNTLPIIDKVMLVIRPFAKQAVLDKVVFHNANMNKEEFYNQWLPKNCLPNDYGGDLPSIQELHLQHIDKLKDMYQYFQAEESQRRAHAESTQ